MRHNSAPKKGQEKTHTKKKAKGKMRGEAKVAAFVFCGGYVQ